MKDNMQEELNKKQKKQAEKKRKRQEYIEELALHSTDYLFFFAAVMLFFLIVSILGAVNGIINWAEAILIIVEIGIASIIIILLYNSLILFLKRKSKNKGVLGFIGNNFGFILCTIMIIITSFSVRGYDFSKENSEKIIQLSWAIEAISLGLFVATHFIIVKVFEDKRKKVLTKVPEEKDNFIRKYKIFNYNDALRAQNWNIFLILVSVIANIIGSSMVMFHADAIEISSVMQGVIFMAGSTTLMSMGLVACLSLMFVLHSNKKLRIQAEDYEKQSEEVVETIPSQSKEQSAEESEAAASVDDSKKKQEKADEVREIKEDEKKKTEETKEGIKDELREEKEGKDGKKE